MSPRNHQVFEAIPFNASYDAEEPLITTRGDAQEEEDQRLEEKTFSRFKITYLLLGFLLGFCHQFSIMEVYVLSYSIWGEDTKSKTAIFGIYLLCSFFFFWALTFNILEFLRSLVKITYSAIAGHSKELPDEIVVYMEYRFVMGKIVGFSLAWIMADVLLGMRAQNVYSLVMILLVVAFCWREIIMMCFAKNLKPSSSRRSTAEQTVMDV